MMRNSFQPLMAVVPPDALELGTRRPLDLKAVQTALDGIARRNGATFNLLIAMICGLFVLQFVALLLSYRQPTTATALVAGSGVTLPFLLYFLRDSWRVKVQADTLLVLAGTLDPAVVRSVVKAFLEGLKSSQSRAPRREAVARGHT